MKPYLNFGVFKRIGIYAHFKSFISHLILLNGNAELVMRLPVTKLPLVYNLLVDLSKKESDDLSSQSNFMLLPLNERRRIMTQQAKELISHYEQAERERQAWQAGDFIDEY